MSLRGRSATTDPDRDRSPLPAGRGPIRVTRAWGTALSFGVRWDSVRAVGLYILATVVAGFAVYLWARFGFTDIAQLAQPDMRDHGDFLSFVDSARAWRDGGDPYLPDPAANVINLNPPVWMPVFAALSLFDPLVAYQLWTVISLALLTVAAMWVAREIDAPPAVAVLGSASLLAS